MVTDARIKDARPDEAEAAAFQEAMADVRPIAHNRLAPEPIWRQLTSISQREQEVLRELDALIDGHGPFPLEETDQYLRGSVDGLDPRVVRDLARGEFTVQADLDLHGCNAPTARARLERFLVEAHARGLRCVKVVHGWGRGSPNHVPVLKPQMPRWLSRGAARTIVLAYTTAPPHDGGVGACYVLLRRGRRGVPSER